MKGKRSAKSFCPNIYIEVFVIKDNTELLTKTFNASLYEMLKV
jgi:hypothetical protein